MYELVSFDDSFIDRDGFPAPDIVVKINDKKIHADLTYTVWCGMLGSSNTSRELYLNTMLSVLLLRVVMKAKAFHNIAVDYYDLRNWALEHIHTKWNFCDLPQCCLERFEPIIRSA